MKKRVYLMTAIGAVVVALTACGGNSGNNKSSSVSSASGSAVSSKTAGTATGSAIEFNPSDYIEKLAEYKGLEYSKMDTEVTDAEVEERVKAFLKNYPDKITDRAIKKGDTANIDYVGKKDGVAFEGGTANGFDLGIGSGSFIPGFEEGLVGKKPGETVDLNLTFPKEYHSEELKGKAVIFTVKINYILGDTPKELTDELVKANTEFKTVAEYKADIKNSIEEGKKEEAGEEIKRELIDKVVTETAIKALPKDLEDEFESQFKDYWNKLAESNGIEMKDFIKNNLKSTEEEFEQVVKRQAYVSARKLVVVRAIADAEKINISDDEYNKELNKYYESSGAKRSMELSEYEKQVGKEKLINLLLHDKVGKFLMENGKEISK
ncbi:MAG: trigger factor [Catonella sp.]|uniref:trigger factor n=1 Tax=Catonella sp. TaxID=2382125 RepID=UPI003FA0A714